MSVYQRLRLWSPIGEFITGLDEWRSIDCVLAENQISPLTVSLSSDYSDEIFQRDCRVSYERSPEFYGSFTTPKLVGGTTWLVSDRERVVETNGSSVIVLRCEHPNRVLGSRVVAYNEGTTQAEKSDIASDVLYDIVNENLVAATDASRNISTSHFVLDPRPGPTFGATVSKSFSYRNVLVALQEIAKASAQQGAYIGFEVYTQVPPGPLRCRFYSGQRGTDRSSTSGQPFIIHSVFSRGNEGTGKSRVTEDWMGIVSHVYAGGSGKLDERSVQTASDSNLINASPFGRVEFFRSVSSDDTAIISSEAQRTLREYRPRRSFEGDFGGAEAFVYDVDYTWGDIVVAQFLAPRTSFGVVTNWTEYKFDVRIDPVHIQVQRFYDEDGLYQGEEETVSVHLRSISST